MTARLRSIQINGFKKFKQFNMFFNPHMNIIVGENEAGKTTILEAIKLVLNQNYRSSDKAYLEELFNKDQVDYFRKNPKLENLPSIHIELEFELDAKEKNSEAFYGEHNKFKNAAYGISFSCCFDEESWGNSLDFSEIRDVPYEFYILKWMNFSGRTYNLLIKPLHFLTLDTSRIDRNSTFNYYNRTVLHSFYKEEELLHKKHDFRGAVIQAFEKITDDSRNSQRKFGVDSKKLILDNLVSILDKGVSLENHGSGMENLIKTKISFERANNIDVVLLEEPENHLSFVNLQKMIDLIIQERENMQLIIATHSSMVATRLDLRNVLWITENQAKSLKNIEEEDAKFFIKLARNSFLQMLLAEKVILVEGITEYLLLPEFYKHIYGHSLQQDNITIISCEGISYKRYLAVTEGTNKWIAVITDNDSNTKNGKHKLEHINALNEQYKKERKKYHIFTSQDKAQWTWEICLYNAGSNSGSLNELIKQWTGEKISSEIDYKEFVKQQKAEFAYQILQLDLIAQGKLKAPNYIEEAFKWLKN